MYPGVYRDQKNKHILAEKETIEGNSIITFSYMCGSEDEHRMSRSEFESSGFTFISPWLASFFDPAVTRELDRLEKLWEGCDRTREKLLQNGTGTPSDFQEIATVQGRVEKRISALLN